MDAELQATILDTLAHARDLTIATSRPDGYPQATVVSYVNDGVTIYFGCGDHSQKARNIALDSRVSVTVTPDYRDWDHIRAISLAGKAEKIADPNEIERVGQLMFKKFPQVAKYTQQNADFALSLYRITPKVISLLDYTKGFGHTELVTVP